MANAVVTGLLVVGVLLVLDALYVGVLETYRSGKWGLVWWVALLGSIGLAAVLSFARQ
jgi:hypothetical protein